MSQKNPPGYPLPAGVLGNDDIVCQLVYLPNRPEYWQALVAALSYMSTWRAWERDTDKRGKDAASNWREAFELTIGCWRMACLEQLQDDVAAILAILEVPAACCDAGDVTDGDQYTDRVTDGVGDVPQNIIDAGYASGTSDWAGFDDYKCMISHVIVDQLNLKLDELAPLVTTTGGVLGGVAAIAGILAVIFGTGGLAIVFGIVAGIGATSLLYQAITDFDLIDGLAAKVVTNHDDLACAVYQSDGDQDSLDNLNDKIDELFTVPEALVLKNMNLGPTLKSLYAGRYDQQDIAEILDDAGYDLLDFDCDVCDQIGEFRWLTDFNDETFQGWQIHDNVVLREEGVGATWCARIGMGSIQNYLYLGMEELLDILEITAGAGDVLTINSIKFYHMQNIEGAARGLRGTLYINHDGGQEVHHHLYESSFTEEEYIFSPPLDITYDENLAIQFVPTITGSLTYWFIDNITLDVDYTPA